MNVIMDVDQAYDILSKEDEIAFDLETSGLSPWRDRIALMQFMGRNSGVPVLIRVSDGLVPQKIKNLLEDPTKLFVGHNVTSFDILFLNSHGINWHRSGWYDTLIGEGIISTTGRRDVSKSLKASVRRRLGLELDKNIEHGNWGAEQLSEDQIKYAAGDVLHILKLMDEQIDRAEQQNQTRALNMEMELLKVVAEMTCNGLPLRRDVLNEWLKKQVDLQKDSLNWLKTELGDINLNSPKQKVDAAKRRGVELENTSSEYLKELTKFGDSFAARLAEKLLDYAGPTQRIKMYNDAWQKMYIVDDWVHPRFWQVGTDTLRFSSSEPNFQQIPKDGRVIIGNIDGLTIVSADYSQIEVRIAAEIAQDQKMIEILKSGDAHTGTASAIFGVPESEVTFNQRRAAKAATFTLLFGGSYKKLWASAKNMGADMTEDDAYEIFNKFFTTFEGLRKIREKAFNTKGMRAVTITFPNSAKRLLVGANITPTRILNTSVQGPAAIGMKYALLEAKKNGIMQYIGATVHDELVAAVPTTKAEEVGKIMEKSMIDGMHMVFPNMDVKVEVKYGKNWQP